jgi:nucleoside 2-deoxyribosyltransferase
LKLVYIAGPFRAANAWEVEQNIRKAEALALEVWKLGAAVVCPHTNTRFFDGALPDATFLAGDLEILSRCDAVLMVDGWEQSRGAVAESVFATDKGIRVFTSLADLGQWLDFYKRDPYKQYAALCDRMERLQ